MMDDERYRIDPLESDDIQEIQIGSHRPMRCFVNRCALPITNATPFLIISTGRGCIFAHMSCLGINTSGNYQDRAYLTHVRDKLLDGLHRRDS